LNVLVNQGSDFIEFTGDYQYLRRKSPFSVATIPQKKPINCSLEVVSYFYIRIYIYFLFLFFFLKKFLK